MILGTDPERAPVRHQRHYGSASPCPPGHGPQSLSDHRARMPGQVPMIAPWHMGAGRVYSSTREPEEDHGPCGPWTVFDGSVEPTEERTGIGRGVTPIRRDGTVNYRGLRGELRHGRAWTLPHDDKKDVLHDISPWGQPGQKIASGATEQARQRSRTCINRFYDIADGKIRQATASTSTRSAADQAVPRRRPAGTSSPSRARSWRTSATAAWTPRTRNASRSRSWPTRPLHSPFA